MKTSPRQRSEGDWGGVAQVQVLLPLCEQTLVSETGPILSDVFTQESRPFKARCASLSSLSKFRKHWYLLRAWWPVALCDLRERKFKTKNQITQKLREQDRGRRRGSPGGEKEGI